MTTITIDLPADIMVPEGQEDEAQHVAAQGAKQALSDRFGSTPSNDTRLQSLLGKIGTFSGKIEATTRPDGKSWSEIEAARDETPARLGDCPHKMICGGLS